MISNFPTPKNYNLGGLSTFQFAPAEAFSVFSGVFNGRILFPLVLNTGFDWFKGYSTAYTLGFTETLKTSEHGKYYEQTITGFVPGDRAELIDLMETMDDRYFVLQVKDANGASRLVGGFGCPMLFSSNYDSGLARSDGKGYQFQFFCQSTFRAPMYL